MFEKSITKETIINTLNLIQSNICAEIQTEETTEALENCNGLLAYFTKDN